MIKWLVLLLVLAPAVMADSLVVAISASGDDGHFRQDVENLITNNVNQYIGMTSGVYYKGILLFQNVTIAAGSVIDSVRFRLVCASTSSATSGGTLYLEDTSSAAAPTDSANFNLRHKTTATATFTFAAPTAGTVYSSTDMKSVVQEVVDRADWASGNNMAVLYISNVGTLRISGASYDNTTYAEPKLAIYYHAASPSFVKDVLHCKQNPGYLDSKSGSSVHHTQ